MIQMESFETPIPKDSHGQFEIKRDAKSLNEYNKVIMRENPIINYYTKPSCSGLLSEIFGSISVLQLVAQRPSGLVLAS